MKIVDANVSLASKHHSSKQFHTEESLTFWAEFQPRLDTGQTNPTQIRRTVSNWEQLITDLQQLLEKYQIEVKPIEEDKIQVKDIDQIKLKIIERFISILTGKKVRFKTLNRPDLASLTMQNSSENNTNSLSQRPIFQFVRNRRETSSESEKLLFTAAGVIKTADGREIDFDTEMFVSREIASLSNISTEAGQLIDPLVINFNGPAAGITETKFSFDLDVDGMAEMIPFVSDGSGLLALDSNQDNIINNGAELFGAITGNGFEELSQYDQDDNGWIDESDQIFNQLRIWTKDTDGHDSLFALGQKGVGAIYLGNVDAQFSVKNQENQLLGQYQKAGIFVREEGTVGTMQQVDFVV
ncbi:MAG: hypothetical protein GXY86_15990 [Firmicutes bacterium]|nr:hypothetical protein [Bacillota bacterium]